MNFNLILTEKNKNIFNIILNDQKNQNTLSENMINELTSAIDIADKDNEIIFVILQLYVFPIINRKHIITSWCSV